MPSTQSLQYLILNEQLLKNQNPLGYKLCIKQLMKGVQDRTFWYFTVQQAQFLSNVYQKQVEQQELRNRLKQITDQAMSQVFDDILTGKLNKIAVQQKGLIATVKILQKVQQIAQAGHDYYSSDNPVVKQTQQKIKQINQDYKKFKQRVQHIKQKQLQKKLQKQSIQRQLKQKIQQQKKLQYHKSVMKRLQIMKLKQEQRIEQNQKFKSFMKQFKKIKPLHILMQQQFKQRIQLPQLQQSRKRLQLYKSKKKPTLQQINDHQRQYIYIKQSKPQKSYVKHQTIDVGYKSHFYKEIQQNQKEKGQEQYNSMLWDQVEKKKRYSIMVKENYKPKVSKKLHESVEISRAQTSLKKIQMPDGSRVKQLGKFYLEYVKSLEKNRSSSQQQKQQDFQQRQKIYTSRYTNYLQDFKKNHQTKLKGLGADWQLDLNDRTASKSQKRDRILIKSKQLEEKVHREQMFIKNHNYGKAEDIIDKKKQIDETLLQAIKAKMALLKDVKEN